jgi:hypothetical protein
MKPRTVSELYPRKWLKACDLEKPVTVTITGAEVEDFRLPDGTSKAALVLTFAKATKRLICNKTQVWAAMGAIGTEVFADWIGHDITLSAGKAPNGKPTIVIDRAAG